MLTLQQLSPCLYNSFILRHISRRAFPFRHLAIMKAWTGLEPVRKNPIHRISSVFVGVRLHLNCFRSGSYPNKSWKHPQSLEYLIDSSGMTFIRLVMIFIEVDDLSISVYIPPPCYKKDLRKDSYLQCNIKGIVQRSVYLLR